MAQSEEDALIQRLKGKKKDGLKFNFNGRYAPALFYKMYLLFICSNNLQFCKNKLSLLMMFTEHSVGGI